MDRYQFFRDRRNSEPCYCDVDVAKDGQYVLYDNHMARVAELKAEIVALKKILAESCDDNRQDYFSTYDCASPCPIGFKVQELEVERDRLRGLLKDAEAVLDPNTDMALVIEIRAALAGFEAKVVWMKEGK